MDKKVIRVGIIGAGFSATIFHAPFIVSNVNYELVCFLRSKQEKVKGFEGYDVYTDEKLFLNLDLDLIIITTPSYNHFEMTKKVLESGKHVIIEKPFTTTTEEAKILTELSVKVNKILAVYHNRRWDGDFITLRDLIKGEKLGRIVEFESHFDKFRNFKRENAWREENLPASGTLYDLGPHLIQQALFLFGKPTSVFAIIENLRKIENGVDDYFTIILKYSEGIVVTLKATMLAKLKVPRYIVHGTKGSYFKYNLDPQEKQLLSGMKPKDKGFGLEENNEGVLSTDYLENDQKIETQPGNYQLFFNNVAEAVQKNDPGLLEIKPEDAILVMEIIESALKSSKTNQQIIL